uniref:Uncharacterized protein n=1 Tax=Vespula pensylvanica TaxID=30213 RepID=A0A834JSW4_VESPE|nr:hypothetical protein H0235_016838 [Vespula pensylvanica]
MGKHVGWLRFAFRACPSTERDTHLQQNKREPMTPSSDENFYGENISAVTEKRAVWNCGEGTRGVSLASSSSILWLYHVFGIESRQEERCRHHHHHHHTTTALPLPPPPPERGRNSRNVSAVVATPARRDLFLLAGHEP